MNEAYRQRIIDYNEKHRGPIKRLKRWFLWFFFNKDYCPSCDKVVRWEDEIFRYGDPIDGFPLWVETRCSVCGLEVPPCGPLIDVIKERCGA
jgi:hypothetical protein